MARAKSHLLGLGKEIVNIAVEYKFAYKIERYHFFRNEFCGVQDVELEFVRKFLIENLQA